jgi:internalin A
MAREGIDRRSWIFIGVAIAIGVVNALLAAFLLFPKPYVASWGEEIDRHEEYLYLRDVTFTQDDLEAIASIKTLKYLSLQNCNVGECRLPELRFASKGIYHLELIDVGGLWDSSFLSDLPVEYLSLEGCTRFDDLSVLNLEELSELDVSGTSVTDLSPLAGSDIRRLKFARTKVSDLAPLAKMPSLRDVDGSDTEVTSLDALKNLSSYSSLAFAGCAIEEVPEGLEYLYALDLSRTKISDFSSLGNIRPVQLDLAGNPQLDDISWLGDDAREYLRHLNLAGTGLEKNDLTLVPRLSKLEELYLDGIALGDLNMFGDLRELRYLSAVGCDLSDVSGVKNLPQIETLLLGYNHIEDLKGLPKPNADWPRLLLDLSHNGLTSLKGLPGGDYRLLLLQGNDIDYAKALNPMVSSYMVVVSWNDSIDGSALSQYDRFSRTYVLDYPESRGDEPADGFSPYQFAATTPDQLLYAIKNDAFDYTLYEDMEWYVRYAEAQGDGVADNGGPFE